MKPDASLKFWNLAVTGEGDTKALDVEIFGVIEPGFWDDAGVKSAEISAQLSAHSDAKTVTVHINSVGGDVFGGIAIYNLLRQHPAAKAGKLTSVVEGLAASAASIIAMAGRTRMMRGSMMMIHNPWTITIGDANDMRSTADMLDSVRDALLSVYRDKTKKSSAQIRALLDEETWMTAEEAKAEGFAEEIEESAVSARARAASNAVVFGSVAFPRDRVPSQVLAAVGIKRVTNSHKGKRTMTMKSETCDGCERDMDGDDDVYCAACHGSVDAKSLLSITGKGSFAEAIATVSAWKIAADEVATMRAQIAAQAAAAEAAAFDEAVAGAKAQGLLAPSDSHKRNVAALAFKGKPNALDSLKTFLAALDPLVGTAAAPPAATVREPAPGNAVVALTPEEVRIAKSMGVSLEAATKNKARLLALVPSQVQGDDADDNDEDAA